MRRTGSAEVYDAIRRHKWVLLSFGVAHTLIFIIPFDEIGQTYSSTGLYFDYASRMMAGHIPYRDFAVEYPPLALLFFLLPRLLASTPQSYATAFAVETLLFSLAGMLVVVLVSQRLGLRSWKPVAAYTAFLLAIGPIVSHRYDIFPAILVLLALYAFLSERHGCAYALLAAGVMTKVYPAALLPVFLLHHYRNHSYQGIRSALLTFAATVLAIALPFFLMSPGGLFDSFTYHAQRGIQLESTYSSLLLVAGECGWLSVGLEFTYGSWNLTGTAADVMAHVSMLVLPLSLLAVYWMIHRHVRTRPQSAQDLVSHMLLVVIVLVATSKVLSPEYMVWLLPLVPLFSGRFRCGAWGVFFAIGVLTYIVYPLRYADLIWLHPGAIVLLLERNVLIVILAVVVAASLRWGPRGGSETRAPLTTAVE